MLLPEASPSAGGLDPGLQQFSTLCCIIRFPLFTSSFSLVHKQPIISPNVKTKTKPKPKKLSWPCAHLQLSPNFLLSFITGLLKRIISPTPLHCLLVSLEPSPFWFFLYHSARTALIKVTRNLCIAKSNDQFNLVLISKRFSSAFLVLNHARPSIWSLSLLVKPSFSSSSLLPIQLLNLVNPTTQTSF